MADTELLLIANIATLFGGLVYSEWRIRRFRAHFAQDAAQSLKDAFFTEEISKSENGQRRVLRPNEAFSSALSSIVPGLIDWARQNVKIKLPPFEIPEGLDLKQVGASVLAQKALSGKKLKIDDAIPLALGYAKDWLEKSGFLKAIGGEKPSKPMETRLPEHLSHPSK